MNLVAKKKYIFGYGSLVSAKDIERTLGRPPEELLPVTLSGWIRDWSIILDNTSTARRYTSLHDHQTPRYVAILNIRRPLKHESPTNPNGVLFSVSEGDIAKMDERERHYVRQNISEQITEAIDGEVFAYVGMEQFLIDEVSAAQAILPRSYRMLVEDGFASLGQQELNQFRATTLPSTLKELATIHTTNAPRSVNLVSAIID